MERIKLVWKCPCRMTFRIRRHAWFLHEHAPRNSVFESTSHGWQMNIDECLHFVAMTHAFFRSMAVMPHDILPWTRLGGSSFPTFYDTPSRVVSSPFFSFFCLCVSLSRFLRFVFHPKRIRLSDLVHLPRKFTTDGTDGRASRCRYITVLHRRVVSSFELVHVPLS